MEPPRLQGSTVIVNLSRGFMQWEELKACILFPNFTLIMTFKYVPVDLSILGASHCSEVFTNLLKLAINQCYL